MHLSRECQVKLWFLILGLLFDWRVDHCHFPLNSLLRFWAIKYLIFLFGFTLYLNQVNNLTCNFPTLLLARSKLIEPPHINQRHSIQMSWRRSMLPRLQPIAIQTLFIPCLGCQLLRLPLPHPCRFILRYLPDYLRHDQANIATLILADSTNINIPSPAPLLLTEDLFGSGDTTLVMSLGLLFLIIHYYCLSSTFSIGVICWYYCVQLCILDHVAKPIRRCSRTQMTWLARFLKLGQLILFEFWQNSFWWHLGIRDRIWRNHTNITR